MARQAKEDKGSAPVQASMADQHLVGEVVWIGFRRHGDGRFTRYQAVTRDGRFVAVDSEQNEGLPSFARDFQAMVGRAIKLHLNPLKRK